MKNISYILLSILMVNVSCVPHFDTVGELSDSTGILEILVGNESGSLAQENAIDDSLLIDTIWVKDRTTDLTNVYLQGNFDEGCKIEPLDGAPKFGSFGDFSTAKKYRVTAPSGNYSDWTIVLAIYTPEVGCLAERWSGNLSCIDGIWASYSPTSCVGVMLNDDCQEIKISFNFWADSDAMVELELELGDIDYDTFEGDVTLVNDVSFSSYGADMTFYAGSAGTYNASSNILNLSLSFSGYDIGQDYYPFTISPN